MLNNLNRGFEHAQFFVVSNNLRRTVEKGLYQLGIVEAFDAVIGVDNYSQP